ncbi:MAG: hypothetical protein ACSLFR_08710 [Solirubrobacteraceae bacterium]
MTEPVQLRDIRRYPHLTREDVEQLRQMPEAMAREYENLLRREYRSEQRHRDHRAESIEIDGFAVARRIHGEGAGGGWRRGQTAGVARDVTSSR